MRFTRMAGLGVAAALLTSTGAQAAELSTSDRLQDRREVAAGTRAYAVGFQDGRFYANGWHITGEMGGVWTPPLKLADGVWFGVDGQWAGQATRFTSGWGYTRYRLPSIDGLRLERTDVVPDGARGALFGLELTNPSRRKRTVDVKVDARSELMGRTHGASRASRRTRATTCPTAARSPAARWRSATRARCPALRRTTTPRWSAPTSGRAAAAPATASGARSPGTVHGRRGLAARCPAECDDGPFGNGTGGELRYRVKVRGHGSKTLWIAVAGSDRGPRAGARASSRG